MLYVAWIRGLPRNVARFVLFRPINKRSFNLLSVMEHVLNGNAEIKTAEFLAAGAALKIVFWAIRTRGLTWETFHRSGVSAEGTLNSASAASYLGSSPKPQTYCEAGLGTFSTNTFSGASVFFLCVGWHKIPITQDFFFFLIIFLLFCQQYTDTVGRIRLLKQFDSHSQDV